jgi:heptaprenyl diphosphate synthase
LFPARHSLPAMRLVDDLGLRALPGDLRRVEEALQAAVRVDDRFLGDVASHLLGAGGKRLRPTLTLCAAYAVAGEPEPAPDIDLSDRDRHDRSDRDRAVTGGASVELVHLGSLYHDDVIDEAETRRGVPSVNARWSNIVAILSGDFLLAQASALAASLGADVAGLLAATIGELCRGQVLELQYLFNPARTEESYFSAIEGKTASLLATAARIGGMVTRAPAPTLDALTRFGHHLGMCFQIVDDVFDVTRTEAELGKPVGNDLLEGVYTLPVIYAVTESTELADLLGRALDPERLERARRLVVTDDAIEASMAVARTHATKATEALSGADDLDQSVCSRMEQLVDGLVLRQS